MKRLLIVCLGSVLVLSGPTTRGAEGKKAAVDVSKIPPASDKQGVTYATDIKPIFENPASNATALKSRRASCGSTPWRQRSKAARTAR